MAALWVQPAVQLAKRLRLFRKRVERERDVFVPQLFEKRVVLSYDGLFFLFCWCLRLSGGCSVFLFFGYLRLSRGALFVSSFSFGVLVGLVHVLCSWCSWLAHIIVCVHALSW